MPVNHPNPTVNIPEQREYSSFVQSLASTYEALFTTQSFQKNTQLLSIDTTIKDISIPLLARSIHDAAIQHGTDKKQIISKEQGIGSYAITHSAEATAVDILTCIATLVTTEHIDAQFTEANVVLAKLLTTEATKSEVARFLRQKVQQLEQSQIMFAKLVAGLRAKSEEGEPALARFAEQFYEAEMLVNIYILQNS